MVAKRGTSAVKRGKKVKSLSAKKMTGRQATRVRGGKLSNTETQTLISNYSEKSGMALGSIVKK